MNLSTAYFARRAANQIVQIVRIVDSAVAARSAIASRRMLANHSLGDKKRASVTCQIAQGDRPYISALSEHTPNPTARARLGRQTETPSTKQT
jgi:hypothetical protein